MSDAAAAEDFLTYNPVHCVLICQQCQYAIQKSAVESHLLRHKIYRGERQRLLAKISRYDLLDPGDVQHPPPGGPPVHGLPLIPGFRCNAPNCESLFASSKRMRKHWTEAHSDARASNDSFSGPAILQTFFRGTKIRYFEVASSVDVNMDLDADAAQAAPLSAPAAQHSSAGHEALQIDLDILSHFHHFTVSTSLTLPTSENNWISYWQHDAAKYALRLGWLTHGLLAIALKHKVSLSAELATQKKHYSELIPFQSSFSYGWNAFVRDAIDDTIEEGMLTIAKLAAQLTCLLRCSSVAMNALLNGTGENESHLGLELSSLPTLMAAIRGCGDGSHALTLACPDRWSTNLTATMATPDYSWASRIATSARDSLLPPPIVQALRTLPFRMAEVFGRPDGALDVLAVFSATDALVDCCFLGYANCEEKSTAAWTSVVWWLQRLPPRFYDMLAIKSPAALVITAYWSVMVKRAETHFWFARGLGAQVCQLVQRELPPDPKVHGLIESFILN